MSGGLDKQLLLLNVMEQNSGFQEVKVEGKGWDYEASFVTRLLFHFYDVPHSELRGLL